eukprot:3487805-Rhodomonas_salina.2
MGERPAFAELHHDADARAADHEPVALHHVGVLASHQLRQLLVHLGHRVPVQLRQRHFDRHSLLSPQPSVHGPVPAAPDRQLLELHLRLADRVRAIRPVLRERRLKPQVLDHAVDLFHQLLHGLSDGMILGSDPREQ